MAPRISLQPHSTLVLLGVSRVAGAHATKLTGPADRSLLFQEIASVYRASKQDRKTRQPPSSSSIVTAVNIPHHACGTPSDVLSSVPSFYSTCARGCRYVGVPGLRDIVQDQIEQDGRAFLLKATCCF